MRIQSLCLKHGCIYIYLYLFTLATLMIESKWTSFFFYYYCYYYYFLKKNKINKKDYFDLSQTDMIQQPI